MNDLLNSTSTLVKEIFPNGLPNPHDGLGIFLEFVVISVFVALFLILLSAAKDLLKQNFQLHLGSSVRLVYAFLWVVAIAVGAAMRAGIFLVAVLACAPLAWWLRLRKNRTQLLTALICVALAASAFALDYTRQTVRRRSARVYFVLAFEDINGSPADSAERKEIVESWNVCRGLLADVFANVKGVEIMPASAKYDDFLFPGANREETFKRLRVDGTYADMVLRTAVAVTSHEGTAQEGAIRMVLTMNQIVRDDFKRVDDEFLIEGSLPDKKLLSLKVALWVRDLLAMRERGLLDQAGRDLTNRRLLDEYATFLNLRQNPRSLIADVRTAIADAGHADVHALLDQYKGPAADTGMAQRDADQRHLDLAKARGKK